MNYYVLSQGENPVKMFFNKEIAFEDGKQYGHAYLDVFNEDGNLVETFKLEYDPKYDDFIWTKDF